MKFFRFFGIGRKQEGPVEEKPAPRRFYIPEEKIEECYRLSGGPKTRLGRYQFWAFVASFIPEVKVGNWSFLYDSIFYPYVEEAPHG